MTADALLVLIFGILTGFCLGYLHAWRLARKLEAHGVLLWKWDRPYDPKAQGEAKASIHEFSRSSDR